MNRPILNIAEVELMPRPPQMAPKGAAAERYDARVGFIGRKIGAQKLGYSLIAVPPGKRAFPLHNHYVNEEMFFILEGSGEVHIGEAKYPVRRGDVIANPPGGPDTAHQIVNTGKDELRYLAVSTQISPDMVDYPRTNTGKFGVLAEMPPGPDGKPRRFAFIGHQGKGGDYWEGE
jgi:uncharacterized cupin superfamily protein